MGKLASIAQGLILERLLSDGLPFTPKKSRVASRLLILSSVLGLVSLGFLIVAMNEYLKTQYPPEMAALLTAGGVFALSLMTGLIAAAINQYQRHRTDVFKNDVKRMVKSTIATLDNELGDTVRDNPLLSVLVSAAAGLKVGDKIL